MNKFAEAILKRSWVVVGAFVLITAFMVVGATRLKIDSSTDAFYPQDNPVMQLNRQVTDTYSAGKSQLILLHADNIFTPENLTTIRALTQRVKDMDGVKRVVSITNAPRMSDVDGVLVTSDLVPDDNPSLEDIASMRQYLDTNYALKDGVLASNDGTATAFMVELLPDSDMKAISAQVEAAVQELWKGAWDSAGDPVLSRTIDRIILDLPLLVVLALVIILSFLALNFRSIFGIVIPLVQLVVGLVWGMGILCWIGMPFQMAMVISPIAILAVGSSFSLHLLGRYFLELGKGKDKMTAIRIMMTQTGMGVFVSGLAISASMLTFLLSGLVMIRGMGLLTTLGVFSCMVASLTLLPALLVILPAPKVRVTLDSDKGIAQVLRAWAGIVGAHPKRVLVSGAILIAVSVMGIFRIVPDSSVISFFPKDSAVVRSTQNIEKMSGGSAFLRVVVDGDLQDPQVLGAMLKYQEEIRKLPNVGPTQSLATTVRTLHETLTGEAGMPSSRELVAQEILVYQSSGSVDDITSMVTLDYSQGLINVMVPRLPTQQSRVLVAQLNQKAQEIIGPHAKLSITGDSFLESILEEILLHDFIISLTLALVLVLLIDSFIRSFRAALVTMTVLFFTIVLQYGVMGIFNLPFNLATALMGALAIGVGDYAIHLTVRYMEDRRRGLEPEAAMVEAVGTSGRSIVFTSLTLGGGFFALSFSTFIPVAILGQLMVFTVFAVGVASLTLLPAACLVFFRNPVSRLEISHE